MNNTRKEIREQVKEKLERDLCDWNKPSVLAVFKTKPNIEKIMKVFDQATNQILKLKIKLPEKKEVIKYKECSLCGDRYINERDMGRNEAIDETARINGLK